MPAKIVLFVTPSQDSTVFGIKAGLEKVLSRRGMRLQLVYTPSNRRISDTRALVDLWHPVGVVADTSRRRSGDLPRRRTRPT